MSRAPDPDPAAAPHGVPHYDGAAVVTGSLIFLVLIATALAVAYFRRRRR